MRLIVSVLAVGAALGAVAPCANAETFAWRVLGAADITSRFIGIPYEGVYPNGIRFSETIRPDGTLVYDADDGANGGRFILSGDEMCFQYIGDERAYCFRVWQRSANCYDGYVDRDPPEERASLVEQALGLSADVRFWSAGEPSTCPAQPTS